MPITGNLSTMISCCVLIIFIITGIFLYIITVCFCCFFQSLKPKAGLFCFLITQARVTTPLEMPDHEYTFVLKVTLY
jgi:uncharacterized protein YpmB